MMIHRATKQFGPVSLSLETGKLAKQADASVIVQQGGSVVLVTIVADREPMDPVSDIVPLTVDYREKTYAAGRIPGGFFKREGRPTEKEILTARLIDRPIRPTVPVGFQHDLQIMASVLSSDGEYDPDVLAVLGGSCVLSLSPVPSIVPVGAVRIGQVDGRWIVNPTYKQLDQSAVDLVIAGTRQGILMIEAGLKEVTEQQLVDAITVGFEQLQDTIALQEELINQAAQSKGTMVIRQASPELLEQTRRLAASKLLAAHQLTRKEERREAREQLTASLLEQCAPAGGTVTAEDVRFALESVERDEVRRFILEKKTRMDGRRFTDLRSVSCEVGVLPRTHGSGLFTRGETQSLAVTTLGTSHDEQLVEALEGEQFKRFMLHYNFPPFSVGEIRPIRGPGRREIGHGALAERALVPMIPAKEEFPYTIRVVSDILESNGSSSMATVCAGTLSLMDAGVPIRATISGIAMGLVKERERVAILTDISGLEDHVGDMDFKVAGSRLGITAMQLDVKLREGLPVELIGDIVKQANEARLAVLDTMEGVIARPRASISMYAPRIVMLKVNPEKIRDVIGPGGRTIRKIIEETGVTIDIEDDGQIAIASTDAAAAEKAIEIVKSLTEEVEVGKLYTGKVKRIMNFGAFCEILPGKEGLVHISELADHYVNKVEDVVKIGDEIRVKVIEIDEQGRINLSRKRALNSS